MLLSVVQESQAMRLFKAIKIRLRRSQRHARLQIQVKSPAHRCAAMDTCGAAAVSDYSEKLMGEVECKATPQCHMRIYLSVSGRGKMIRMSHSTKLYSIHVSL